MPHKYKLHYFNARGRAEVARLLFALAGEDFEDVRIEREDWPKIKPTTPYGQLPYIEIDGQAFTQSNAICRFLAKEFGFYGKTPEDCLRIDMVVDTVEDSLKPILANFREQDESKKEATRKKFEEEQYPAALENLEKILKTNNGGDGFFVGDEATWADLMFFNWALWPANDVFKAKVDLSKTPRLEALYEKVEMIPRIAAWLEKRPVTMA